MSNVIDFPIWNIKPSFNANEEWLEKVFRSAYENNPRIPKIKDCNCPWRETEGPTACLECDDNPLMEYENE